MINKISIKTIVILAIITIAAVNMFPKVIAQSSSFSNTTTSSDTIEKLFAKAHSSMSMAAGGAHSNNYSAWLFVCKTPPIINAESQCDTPTQLH